MEHADLSITNPKRKHALNKLKAALEDLKTNDKETYDLLQAEKALIERDLMLGTGKLKDEHPESLKAIQKVLEIATKKRGITLEVIPGTDGSFTANTTIKSEYPGHTFTNRISWPIKGSGDPELDRAIVSLEAYIKTIEKSR